ncbi:MAG: FtsX-like permease family protein, partial [Saprospiraceae bacterium]|nr:FtsX-like permease family protein [Saprospiraceae bacterium]
SLAFFNYQRFSSLAEAVLPEGRTLLATDMAEEIRFSGVQHKKATLVRAVNRTDQIESALIAGNGFKEEAQENKRQIAVINTLLARHISGVDSVPTALGRSFFFSGREYVIEGIIKGKEEDEIARVFIPIATVPDSLLREYPPMAVLEASEVEAVSGLKERTDKWLATEFGEAKADFNVRTNEFRLSQATQGFLLFRLIMGLIVGISVLVGGIGVMNVLLISVGERTTEIGIRKAVGATRRDIMRQFLSESILISAIGCLLGLLLGIAGTLVVVPIVKALTDAPFQAAFTLNTLGIIAVVALLIGIIFGTYPAMKAARLDPVEAMRRE